jgi:hypothetical protein
VTENSEPVDLDTIIICTSILTKKSGCWAGEIVVNFTHGFTADQAQDLRDVVLSLIDQKSLGTGGAGPPVYQQVRRCPDALDWWIIRGSLCRDPVPVLASRVGCPSLRSTRRSQPKCALGRGEGVRGRKGGEKHGGLMAGGNPAYSIPAYSLRRSRPGARLPIPQGGEASLLRRRLTGGSVRKRTTD